MAARPTTVLQETAWPSAPGSAPNRAVASSAATRATVRLGLGQPDLGHLLLEPAVGQPGVHRCGLAARASGAAVAASSRLGGQRDRGDRLDRARVAGAVAGAEGRPAVEQAGGRASRPAPRVRRWRSPRPATTGGGGDRVEVGPDQPGHADRQHPVGPPLVVRPRPLPAGADPREQRDRGPRAARGRPRGPHLARSSPRPEQLSVQVDQLPGGGRLVRPAGRLAGAGRAEPGGAGGIGEHPGPPPRPAPRRRRPGTRSAASPTSSGMPPTAVATSGVPARSASWAVSDRASQTEGSTQTSAAPSRSATSVRRPEQGHRQLLGGDPRGELVVQRAVAGDGHQRRRAQPGVGDPPGDRVEQDVVALLRVQPADRDHQRLPVVARPSARRTSGRGALGRRQRRGGDRGDPHVPGAEPAGVLGQVARGGQDDVGAADGGPLRRLQHPPLQPAAAGSALCRVSTSGRRRSPPAGGRPRRPPGPQPVGVHQVGAGGGPGAAAQHRAQVGGRGAARPRCPTGGSPRRWR